MIRGAALRGACIVAAATVVAFAFIFLAGRFAVRFIAGKEKGENQNESE